MILQARVPAAGTMAAYLVGVMIDVLSSLAGEHTFKWFLNLVLTTERSSNVNSRCSAVLPHIEVYFGRVPEMIWPRVSEKSNPRDLEASVEHDRRQSRCTGKAYSQLRGYKVLRCPVQTFRFTIKSISCPIYFIHELTSYLVQLPIRHPLQSAGFTHEKPVVTFAERQGDMQELVRSLGHSKLRFRTDSADSAGTQLTIS
jgi:hypothetical protein